MSAGPSMVPVDGAARDRIRRAIGESLFVDAGAGSGKTTALVGRIVELIRDGLPVTNIAAITFTEAAAAELRHRLRRAVRQAAGDATDLFEQGRLLAALDGLDGAAIQTLHAFAQRILRQFPVEAGLPPSIEVADEIASVVRFTARWRAFRDQWEADPSWQPVLRRFLLVGGKASQLADLARLFNDHWDRLAPVAGADSVSAPTLAPIDLAPLADVLGQTMRWCDRCTAADDKLLAHLTDRVAPALTLLEGVGDDDDERLRALSQMPKFTSRLGDKDAWGGAKPEVVDRLNEAQAVREQLVTRITDGVVVALRRRVAAFVVEAAGQRRRAGHLEFHDLLVLARDLLRDHAEARMALRSTYRTLLLDEFQDTDPLQLDMARLIAGEVEAGEVEAGRLFFVGDPKQSIYRFRRADLTVYLDTRHRFAAGLCELSSNFRTVPGVIDWVNGVFAHLMVGDGQAPFLPLAATRPPLGDGHPPVVVAGGAIEASAAEVRRISAGELAAVILEMLEAGWLVEDVDSHELRAVRLDDICVLVPSRLAVPALEDAFARADLPYRLLTSSLVWSSQEVREVLAVLRSVDDPGDEVALVAALRSPIFACSDSNLFEWSAAGGRWSFLTSHRPDVSAGHPVAAALDVLARLHEDRWWLGPDGLIDRLLSEHGVLELALVAGRRRDRWRRLRFLADQAQAFVESQHGDLTSFLEWIELQSSDVVRVSSPVLPEPDDPAIRVMTIHGSKGLEFPVVALFGLGVSTQVRASSVLWSGDHPEVRLSRDLASAGYVDVLTAEEQMDRAERVRLLYVGATRARDHLVVCTHHKAVKTSANPSLGSLFEQALDELDPALVTRWDADVVSPPRLVEAPTLPLPQPATDDPAVAATRAERAAFLAERAAALAPGHRGIWSATAVAKAERPDALDTDGDAARMAAVDDETAGVSWRRGRAGTAIGRAVHGTLQLIDFADLDRLDSIARAQASAEGVDAYLAEITQLARSGATAPLIVELAGREHWREMYVAAPIEGVTVEGYVDLLADDGEGGLVVVDYKTDAVRGDAQIAERAERYRLQAATYALVIEAVTEHPVTRAVFLFLGPGGAVPVDVEDLDAAKRDARAVLADRAAPAEGASSSAASE